MSDRRLVHILALALLIGGCTAAETRMRPGDLLRLQASRDLVAVYHEPPPLHFWRPGHGLAAAANDGRQLRGAYAVQDPAARVRDRVLSALQSEVGLPDVRRVELPLGRDDAGDPAAGRSVTADELSRLSRLRAALGTATLFEFETADWGLGFDFQDPGRYGVYYSVLARLLRLEDSRVLWRAPVRCGFARKGTANPTLAEWLANQGVLLRAKLDEAADECAQQLVAHFRGREMPPR